MLNFKFHVLSRTRYAWMVNWDIAFAAMFSIIGANYVASQENETYRDAKYDTKHDKVCDEAPVKRDIKTHRNVQSVRISNRSLIVQWVCTRGLPTTPLAHHQGHHCV